MKKHIKYIAFYANSKIKNENRVSALSAINKIDYICNVLVKKGYEVEIISPSWTNNYKGFYRSNYINISNGVNLKLFASFGANNKLKRIMKYIFTLIQLIIYLFQTTKRNDTIIVYHSTMVTIPIRIVKFLKNLKVVLEVEEIYQDIQDLSKFMKASELNAFSSADAFFFSTELLSNKIKIYDKPFVTINGTYKVEKCRNKLYEDDKIHVVYAGTFDPKKGGADIAVASSEFLNSKYHLHIIGFGTPEQVLNIKKQIMSLRNKTRATITYDGLLTGEDYITFIQKCHIGLSTQIPDAEYNESSFPSKILSYISNGLRVVSVRIKVVETSEIGNIVYYYNQQNPKDIADTISKINFSTVYNSRDIMKALDENFSERLIELLEEKLS